MKDNNKEKKVGKKQGMVVSCKELRDLADKLEKEIQETYHDTGFFDLEKPLEKQEILIPIFNKTGLSDEWRLNDK